MLAIDQIRQGGTVYEIVPEIAELFSTTKSYSAGDSVIYEAGWYTFKADKYAGAWDATKVDGPFKVTNRISELKEDLTGVYDVSITIESGTYQDTDGVTKYANANRARNANAIDLLHFISLTMPSGYSMTILYLDESMHKVSAVNWVASIKKEAIPATARYMNLYIRNNSHTSSSIVNEIDDIQSDIIAKFESLNDVYERIDTTNDRIDAIESNGVEPIQIAKESTPNIPVKNDNVNVYSNACIQNYDISTYAPNIISAGTNTIKQIKADKSFNLQFAQGTDASYNYGYVVTLTGYKDASHPNTFLKGFTISSLRSATWCTMANDVITIDVNAMISAVTPDLSMSWDSLLYAYVSVPNANDAVYGLYPNGVSYGIDDFKWLKEAVDTEIVLPKKWIVTDGGIEYNIYKNSILSGRQIDDIHLLNFAVTDGTMNTNWYQDKYRTIWMPNGAMNTSRKVTLYKYDQEHKSAEKYLVCVSTAISGLSGKSKKCLVIGDSKVAGGRITQRLYTRCNSANMTLALLGTIIPWSMDQYAHEGRAGWSAYNYTHDATYHDATNPFYNNGFDFSYYMTNQSYTDVDYVFINLGVNDVSLGYENSFVDNINTMIASIHAFDSNIKIIIGLCEGQCIRYYNANVLDFNEKIQKLHIASLNAWDDRETDNIFVCPIYLSMDMYNDFNMTEVPLSQNDEIFETGKTRWQVNDITHQSNVGYGKNADYMFAMISYIESLAE